MTVKETPHADFQPWVVLLLQSIRPSAISEESWAEEIFQAPFAWRRIGNLFMSSFGNDSMLELLGSVLTDLPQEAFLKILEVSPIFILSRGAGFCQKIHSDLCDRTLIIFSEEDLGKMSWLAQRGLIVHELAHTYSDHLRAHFSLDDPNKFQLEAEADNLCRQWSFDEEVKAVRKFLKERSTTK
jgi:hypothetical protein